MSDLISRSALLDSMPKATELLRHQVVDVICNAPSIDVAPVVHANWVKDDEGHTRCSNCMERLPFVHCYSDVTYVEWYEEIEETMYCPHCGAKMDEQEDER